MAPKDSSGLMGQLQPSKMLCWDTFQAKPCQLPLEVLIRQLKVRDCSQLELSHCLGRWQPCNCLPVTIRAINTVAGKVWSHLAEQTVQRDVGTQGNTMTQRKVLKQYKRNPLTG